MLVCPKDSSEQFGALRFPLNRSSSLLLEESSHDHQVVFLLFQKRKMPAAI